VTFPDLGSSLPEIVVRTAIVYLFLVVVLRISGKRAIGQLTILELIVVLVVSDAVQNSMVGENVTLWGGLVAVLTLIALDQGLSLLLERWTWFRILIEGEPRVLVRDGKPDEQAIAKEKVDLPDIERAARRNGLERLDEVRLAVLETDGSISIIPMRGGGSG
jgi:uncharacterized membrane protein YcaP (DUF421 family)